MRELSPRDIEHDNPEFRRLEETLGFLRQIYGRDIDARGHRDRDPLLAGRRAAWRRSSATARRRRPQLGRSRSMSEYSFLTTWCLEAPREPVWDAIWDSERWPRVVAWRDGGREARRGRRGPGSARSGATAWRSKLPYDLDFEMTTTRVGAAHLLEGEASGELAGVGRWRLFERGRRRARDRGRLRVERAHHQALDEPAGAARRARSSTGTTTG